MMAAKQFMQQYNSQGAPIHVKVVTWEEFSQSEL